MSMEIYIKVSVAATGLARFDMTEPQYMHSEGVPYTIR
jgi:hypothetical protein